MTASLRKIPASIWALGFVSLLMDVSSELIHSLLPVFMVTTLGISMFVVGLIEGAAEATALIIKVFSGALSDYWGKRKPLAVLGYGLGAFSKPLFALATSGGWIITARLADRVGKGIRGAPRDALVADIAPPELRGAAFGLRQSLDTVGAFLGPTLAVAFMLLWNDNFRAVFWVATVPAFMCVALLVWGVKEPDQPITTKRSNPISRANLARLSPAYWWVVGVGAIFTLARFSEAFLVLRAQQGGLALAWTPLVLIGMNFVYASCAYPFGKLADKVRHTSLLGWGLLLLIGADSLLAYSNSGVVFWAGVALWGLHMAMTQGLLAAMVADTAPTDLRGTGYGFFNLLSGVAMLIASGLAGWLWQGWGASFTFVAGIGFAALALLLLVLQPRGLAR
ncbi:major facilitator superfamily MFS_1 [Rhodoferax ferrireducens T118]|uniref:Major facilitator superfamily MFS_1 n=1 Tax=Albidiferax ferrireducens (strain ATCC BAA-621 / DSM 15236 / T118) TaxID=338969 RepID=Q21VH3_ALBFT|nr:MFS transporter [Rhodoferax ferrireducens]ABD70230.1 major facilitator superfamily MFS_1 [Rhodoferax ferrireducens T118]